MVRATAATDHTGDPSAGCAGVADASLPAFAGTVEHDGTLKVVLAAGDKPRGLSPWSTTGAMAALAYERRSDRSSARRAARMKNALHAVHDSR
jgi:hypothetical protein